MCDNTMESSLEIKQESSGSTRLESPCGAVINNEMESDL